MGGGYIRLATSTATNDTSHTLAVVTLFFYLLFAVYITGHVGNFKESNSVIRTISQLHDRYPDLFPAPELYFDLNAKGKGRAETSAGDTRRKSFEEGYAEAQSFAGVNNSWRPQKHLEQRNTSDRRQLQLLFQSLAAVMVSWGAAFSLSYLTPVQGLGCRSGSWMVITLAWLISALFDFGLRCSMLGMSQKRPKRLTKNGTDNVVDYNDKGSLNQCGDNGPVSAFANRVLQQLLVHG